MPYLYNNQEGKPCWLVKRKIWLSAWGFCFFESPIWRMHLLVHRVVFFWKLHFFLQSCLFLWVLAPLKWAQLKKDFIYYLSPPLPYWKRSWGVLASNTFGVEKINTQKHRCYSNLITYIHTYIHLHTFKFNYIHTYIHTFVVAVFTIIRGIFTWYQTEIFLISYIIDWLKPIFVLKKCIPPINISAWKKYII